MKVFFIHKFSPKGQAPRPNAGMTCPDTCFLKYSYILLLELKIDSWLCFDYDTVFYFNLIRITVS